MEVPDDVPISDGASHQFATPLQQNNGTTYISTLNNYPIRQNPSFGLPNLIHNPTVGQQVWHSQFQPIINDNHNQYYYNNDTPGTISSLDGQRGQWSSTETVNPIEIQTMYRERYVYNPSAPEPWDSRRFQYQTPIFGSSLPMNYSSPLQQTQVPSAGVYVDYGFPSLLNNDSSTVNLMPVQTNQHPINVYGSSQQIVTQPPIHDDQNQEFTTMASGWNFPSLTATSSNHSGLSNQPLVIEQEGSSTSTVYETKFQRLEEIYGPSQLIMLKLLDPSRFEEQNPENLFNSPEVLPQAPPLDPLRRTGATNLFDWTADSKRADGTSLRSVVEQKLSSGNIMGVALEEKNTVESEQLMVLNPGNDNCLAVGERKSDPWPEQCYRQIQVLKEKCLKTLMLAYEMYRQRERGSQLCASDEAELNSLEELISFLYMPLREIKNVSIKKFSQTKIRILNTYNKIQTNYPPPVHAPESEESPKIRAVSDSRVKKHPQQNKRSSQNQRNDREKQPGSSKARKVLNREQESVTTSKNQEHQKPEAVKVKHGGDQNPKKNQNLLLSQQGGTSGSVDKIVSGKKAKRPSTCRTSKGEVTARVMDSVSSFAQSRPKLLMHKLLTEINEINHKFNDIKLELDWENNDDDSEDCDKFICTYNSSLSSYTRLDLPPHIFQVLKLKLIVPSAYPDVSPVISTTSNASNAHSVISEALGKKAHLRLSLVCETFSNPFSLEDITSAWQTSARSVMEEYVVTLGGQF